ncbi:GspH/FimT family pseudopilin [Halomonas sp. LR5S13]|uniref:GspH/FimT family pseudopilin n=1 Tax=Halomonas rhizosphaerae TaxID=3043296 RepID=UPI0024A8C0E3|nr:GspH/FimT family pseudopilin [Halomonas rhizosphaerae]MDI5922436.1 GspH/FimT family pseudopilin [Halomonas rhizosphaerae]
MRPAARYPLSSRQHGLTLIELIVAIAVLAIMVTWAIPSLQRFSARNEVAAEVLRIKTALALARNTAVTRRTTISVCPLSTPGSTECDISDWSLPIAVVLGHATGGNLSGEGDKILKVLEGSQRPNVTFNRAYPIRYSGIGWSRGHNGTFEICGRDGKGVKVILNNLGRVRTGSSDDKPEC